LREQELTRQKSLATVKQIYVRIFSSPKNFQTNDPDGETDYEPLWIGGGVSPAWAAQQDADMNEPLVSVIIPCYKQAHFLGEAIESVLRQTYRTYEIIVIDDGSPDNTAEVAARYPHVLLISQRNQGLAAARNSGIKESHGEYLVFLDADDRLLPKAMESGIGCMLRHPQSAFVFGSYYYINLDGAPLSAPSPPYHGDDLYFAMLDRNRIEMGAAVMYRRDIFDSIGGFKTSLRAAEDYDLYLRIARSYPCHHHDEVVAEYRKHETTMTKDYALMLATTITVLRSQRRYISGDKKYEEAYLAGLKSWQECYGEPLYLRTITRMWEPREWKQTLRGLWCLLRYYPQAIYLHGSNRLSNIKGRFRNALRFVKSDDIGP
jgi:glycosyltransferase involved in cell wall biosynthesis